MSGMRYVCDKKEAVVQGELQRENEKRGSRMRVISQLCYISVSHRLVFRMILFDSQGYTKESEFSAVLSVDFTGFPVSIPFSSVYHFQLGASNS